MTSHQLLQFAYVHVTATCVDYVWDDRPPELQMPDRIKRMKLYSNDTIKGGSRRLEKSHEVWMMMVIAASFESGPEQLKSLSSLK